MTALATRSLAGRLMALVAAAFALALALSLLTPAAAHADEVAASNVRASTEDPTSVTFHARVTAPAGLEEAEVIFRVLNPKGDVGGSGTATFGPGPENDVSFTLQTITAQRYIPVGSIFRYHWEFTDSEGEHPGHGRARVHLPRRPLPLGFERERPSHRLLLRDERGPRGRRARGDRGVDQRRRGPARRRGSLPRASDGVGLGRRWRARDAPAQRGLRGADQHRRPAGRARPALHLRRDDRRRAPRGDARRHRGRRRRPLLERAVVARRGHRRLHAGQPAGLRLRDRVRHRHRPHAAAPKHGVREQQSQRGQPLLRSVVLDGRVPDRRVRSREVRRAVRRDPRGLAHRRRARAGLRRRPGRALQPLAGGQRPRPDGIRPPRRSDRRAAGGGDPSPARDPHRRLPPPATTTTPRLPRLPRRRAPPPWPASWRTTTAARISSPGSSSASSRWRWLAGSVAPRSGSRGARARPSGRGSRARPASSAARPADRAAAAGLAPRARRAAPPARR